MLEKRLEKEIVRPEKELVIIEIMIMLLDCNSSSLFRYSLSKILINRRAVPLSEIGGRKMRAVEQWKRCRQFIQKIKDLRSL